MSAYFAIFVAILIMCLSVVEATDGVTRSTVVIRRGAEPSSSITSSMSISAFGELEGPEIDECTYDGGIISLSHPMSLKPSDKFFSTGQLQLAAIEMVIDEINTSPRCGVAVGGKKYGIHLTTFGDDSSKEKVEAIVQNGMIPLSESADYAASYWVGPYSSGLTGIMSPMANSTGSLLVANGAAATSVFANFPTVFGTFPPSNLYLAQAIEALVNAGAKTAVSLFEPASFTKGVCAAMPALADKYNLTLKDEIEISSSPTSDDLDPIARNLSVTDPDIVVSCFYDQACAEWVSSLRKSGWSPRAQIFTICVGMDKFTDKVGSDAMFMMGISPWDPSLTMQDQVVQWTAMEFAELFYATTKRTSTYHAAAAAASVGVLVQAIERADSFNVEAVRNVLATQQFETLYGLLSFDINGQSQAPSLHLQYDKDLKVQTVYPREFKSGDLVYPMPTWNARDCDVLSECLRGAETGECQADGTCKCDTKDAMSFGVGSTARCVYVPEEDFALVGEWLTFIGYALFVIQALLSLACTFWTVRYRNHRIVKASQPLFLCLIVFGCFVMSLSIIPLGSQGKYRYLIDPETGLKTDESNVEIRRVDVACMAVPWLFSLGFAVTFSALFAKIWRIKLVFQAARRFVRKQVGVWDVASIMVAVIALQMIILVAWNITDPFMWQREVLSRDRNGFPTRSIGTCSSNNALAFLVPLLAIDALMLLYALYLCFITRKVSAEYQEGMWITASILSIFQILILSVPIVVIVDNDNSANYFVKVTVIFLVSSTVTMITFFPKMYRLKMKGGRRETNRFSVNSDGMISSTNYSKERRNSEDTRRLSIGSNAKIISKTEKNEERQSNDPIEEKRISNEREEKKEKAFHCDSETELNNV